MAGQMVHLEIPAGDTGRAREFWGGLFGWEFQAFEGSPSEYHMTRFSDNQGGAITEADGNTKGPRVYFDVDEINAGVVARQGARRPGERPAARARHGLVLDLHGHRRQRLRPLADRRVRVDVGVAAQTGSVTTRRSPSSTTSPPSERTSRTATAAPRSLAVSPRTIGAAAATTGSKVTRGPSTEAETSTPPWRAAAPRSAASDALHRLGIDQHGRTGARCAVGSELERVRLAHDGVVAAALDPGGEREQVEQPGELSGGGVDQAEVAEPLVLVELVHAQHRLREAGHGRERRPQVVAGERDEAGEVVGHGAASVTA